MTVLHQSPIFGPVHSRRLGISLGINLLPGDGKCCSFDCIYCECGFNKDFRPLTPLPTQEEVISALEARLIDMQASSQLPDVLTFAGNGEPTLHPQFGKIIDHVIALRNKYCPNAKVSVLSNSTQILKPEVFDALLKVDNNILKLDTVSTDYINEVDRPNAHFNLNDIVEQMRKFNRHCIIQTMFMTGEWNGKDISNVSQSYVQPWLDTVTEISPSEVMIYTIDRETPVRSLQKAAPEQLDYIAEQVRDRGIKCQVSY